MSNRFENYRAAFQKSFYFIIAIHCTKMCVCISGTLLTLRKVRIKQNEKDFTYVNRYFMFNNVNEAKIHYLLFPMNVRKIMAVWKLCSENIGR